MPFFSNGTKMCVCACDLTMNFLVLFCGGEELWIKARPQASQQAFFIELYATSHDNLVSDVDPILIKKR